MYFCKPILSVLRNFVNKLEYLEGLPVGLLVFWPECQNLDPTNNRLRKCSHNSFSILKVCQKGKNGTITKFAVLKNSCYIVMVFCKNLTGQSEFVKREMTDDISVNK